MPEKTIYMIDGTAYIYRAFHAIRSLANSKGLPTNAVFGFSRMLIKLVQDRSPEHLIMFFDSRGPTFRHEMYKEYKANRPPMPEDLAVQIPLIKKVTEAFSIPIVEMPGYEADDLIGTMARLAEKEGCSVVMVSGDKDFVQLITERTVLWDPMKDKTTDLNAVREKFGVEPRQIIEVMGLSGDSADNVPGVRGVGPKTAITLIKTFGDMDALYERVDEITKKKQHENLVACKELAFLSRRLVTIDTEAPTSFDVESCKYTPPDNARLSELFKELEFRQLQQEFHQEAERPEKKYTPIMDEEALAELIRRLEAAEVFALDTETTSKSPMNARLVGLSFALEPHEAFYIPCKHDYLGVPDQLPRSRVLDLLRPVLENPDVHKVGQNIKYDWIVLERHGVRLAGVVFDTMLASYLINPTRRGHGLDQMAMDLFNYKMTSYKEVTAKVKGSFAGVPLEKAAPYACEDADLTLMASDVLKPRLEEAGLTTLMAEVEMPLAPVLKEMEMTGVCVDREKLKLLS
ncbi:MAG: DNA polymerase I, partial [Desulfobacterales bacterium]|nr:DNA polymerase I [Desulfobacterales bacterium]